MMEVLETIKVIKDKVTANLTEDALKLLEQLESTQLTDPQIHIELADLAEELGDTKRLILELHLALRDSPKDPAVLLRLSDIYLDDGNYEKALKTLKELININPGNKGGYIKLGSIFEEQAETALAVELYNKAFEATKDDYFHKRAMAVSKGRGAEGLSKEQTDETENWLPTDSQLIDFISLFNGREGVWARQWASPTGEAGYTPVKEPFTVKEVKNHILGNYTAGLYQLRLDNTVNFIAFDFDLPKNTLTRVISQKSLFDSAMRSVHKAACKLVDYLASLEIPAYLEDSGHKGRHVWVFTDSPTPSKPAKTFAETALNKSGVDFDGISVEVFPKQTKIREDGLGNLIKLPLGIHRKTSRRGLFVDKDGNSFEHQLSYLSKIKKVAKQKIFDYIEQNREIFFEPQGELPVIPPIDEQHIYKRPVSVEREFDLALCNEFQLIMLKCAVIRFLVEKINSQKELSSDEIQVLTFSLGNLKEGNLIVNTLFSKSPFIDQERYLKSPLKGHPISCPRIRQRVSHITSMVDCNCRFDNTSGLYPSPNLHIKDNTMETGSLIFINTMGFNVLIQDYLKAKRNHKQVEELVNSYQNRLNQVFDEAGVEEVETTTGKLKRVKTGENLFNFTIEVS